MREYSSLSWVKCSAPFELQLSRKLSGLKRRLIRTPMFSSIAPLPTPLSKCCCRGLEGEIHTCADHAEVVMRSVHKVPAEVTDPANVRGEPNFHSAANLTDRPRLGVSMTDSLHNVEAFSRFSKCLIDWPLTATKDPAGASKNIRRKARARNWIAESESTQHGSDRVALTMETALKNSVTEIDEDVFAFLVCINHPPFRSEERRVGKERRSRRPPGQRSKQV